jgi:multidrug resistance efflux pump
LVVVSGAATAVAQDRGKVSGRHPSLDGVGAFNHVEVRTTVMACPKAEGAHVSRGELVCELDPAPLNDLLLAQKITTMGALASYHNARLSREVAEMAVVEYLDGISKQELETASGEIALAEIDLKRTEGRLEWSNLMYAMGYTSLGESLSDKLFLRRAVFAMEKAQTKKRVLQQYTKEKTLKQLRSAVEKARSDELAKQSTWELEKSKELKIRTQLSDCRVNASAAGTVRYAPEVEKGAVVHDGQLLFRVVPDTAPEVGEPATKEAGRLQVPEPKEGDRVVFESEDYEAVRMWLLEDEFELVEARTFL